MPYRDKEKRNQASRDSMKRKREGLTKEGLTSEGLTDNWYPNNVTPGVMTEDQKERYPNIPLPFGEAYYKALAEQEGVEVTYEVKPEVPQHAAIVRALSDPAKRAKLEKVYTELKNHGVLKEVRFGVDGPTFDVVGELLEVTN